MVSVLDSGANGPGSGPGRERCVVFLGKTLYSQGASLQPRCINGYRRNAGGNPAMDWHPIQGGVEILLVASCHGNRDKLRPDGPLGSYGDFTYLPRKWKLENVKSYKYLGLIMSPFGNFNLARQELKKVALKALYKLRKEMGNHFRENIKLTMKLFDALISPILFYASEVWGIDCNEK